MTDLERATSAAAWLQSHRPEMKVVPSEKDDVLSRGLHWEFVDDKNDDAGWIGHAELIELAREEGWKG